MKWLLRALFGYCGRDCRHCKIGPKAARSVCVKRQMTLLILLIPWLILIASWWLICWWTDIR